MRPALYQLRNKHDLIGAEIGVFHGNYALIYLEKLDIKKIFLIDPYVEYENYDKYRPRVLKEAEETAHAKLSIYKDKIEWVKAKSAEASMLFDDESLDFVYIDGNHEYQAVLEDITLYYPKVKKGGMISGHDYKPTVKNEIFDATQEFCKENNLQLHIISYDWWIWK